MKFRNKFIAKRIGTKTLASLLAFGMALGSPMAAFADDGETAVVAENTVQAKKTDGSEAFVSVSDYVLWDVCGGRLYRGENLEIYTLADRVTD